MMGDTTRTILDLNAGGWSLAALLGLLQPAAALVASVLSIIWLCIQISEFVRKKQSSPPSA